MTRPVSVVIPACGGTEDFHRHLPSLMAEIGERSAGDELIVVDDTEDDDIRSWFAENYAPVRMVRHGETRGYGHALLSGAGAAENDLILFLASGVEVRGGSIGPLVEALAADVLAASPVFVKDARQGTGSVGGQAVWSANFLQLLGARAGPDFVDDRALLIRRDDLPGESTANLLSPYCVDPSELQRRARKRGARMVQVPGSEMDFVPVDAPVGPWENLRDLALARNVLLAHWLHLDDDGAGRDHLQNLRDHVEGFARLGRSEELALLVLALDRVEELRTAREGMGSEAP